MMFRNYVQSMLMGQPYQPMFDADKGGGAGSGEGGQEGSGGEGGEGSQGGEGGAAGEGSGGEGDKPTFDEKQQAEIDKIIARTIAKERSKADKAAKDAVAEAERKAKLTAEQKAEEDRKDRERLAAEKEQKANTRIVNLEIKDVARELGVSSKKLERFLKVVDREDLEVDEDGNVDRKKVESAVKAVLADMPEFKGVEQKQGPGGDFGGGGDGAKYSLAQIKSMSPEEMAKNYDEVMKSMKIHQKQ